MTVSRIATTNAPAAVGPYSQGVSTGQGAGSLVFVSGQVPLDPATGALVEGDIQAQAEQVLKNVGAILAEAGLGYDDVVKTTVLLADIADFAAVNEVYARYFTGETRCPYTGSHSRMSMFARSASHSSARLTRLPMMSSEPRTVCGTFLNNV